MGGKWKKGNSWFWRGFTNALNFINANLGWIIGKGDSVSIWNYNWIADINGFRKPFSTIINPDLCAKDLWNSNNKWDIMKSKEPSTTIMMWRIF